MANILTGSRQSHVYPVHFRAYGLGLFMADYAGKQVYWHTGGAFGMVTNVCFVPEEKLGITILTNNDNQSFFEALRYQILDAYLGVKYTDRSAFQYTYFCRKKSNGQSPYLLKTRVDTEKSDGNKAGRFYRRICQYGLWQNYHGQKQ